MHATLSLFLSICWLNIRLKYNRARITPIPFLLFRYSRKIYMTRTSVRNYASARARARAMRKLHGE